MEHIEESTRAISEYMALTFPRGSYEIILVDDGSSDGTREFLKKMLKSNIFKVELNPKNLGRGGAVKRGLELAQGSIYGFMDIDREVSEVYLPQLAKSIRSGADLVVGRRTYTWTYNPFSLIRHIASVGYRQFTKLFLKQIVQDSEAGYKFFSKRARDTILKMSKFDNWFWDTECVLIADMCRMTYEEIPVLFIRNPKKTSTVRLFHDIVQYLRAISQFKKLRAVGSYECE